MSFDVWFLKIVERSIWFVLRCDGGVMKKPNYRVRILDGSVIVEHRVSLGPVALSFLMVGYIGYCSFSGAGQSLVDFYTSRDAATGALALLLLLIPALFVVGWLRFASGEVLCCDRNDLRFARRRMFKHWQRFQFPASDVKQLRRAIRTTGKTSYSVVTFEVQGRAYDLLENLKYTDCDRVLRACRAMGFDVVIDETADAMLKDIEKRGWWINPFRTDDLGGRPDSSRE